MPDFYIDRRDIDFNLYEQFNTEMLTEFSKYEDFDREAFDMILTEAFKFACEKMAPTQGLSDKDPCKLVDGKVVISECFREVYQQFVEGGFVAPPRDPEFGGMGLPLSITLALNEAFMGSALSFMFVPGLALGAGHLVEVFAEDKLKQLVVPKIYSGEWSGTMCLTEPQAGTSVGDLKTAAYPTGESGAYKIQGNKIFISAGDHNLTDNIIHMVLARVEGDAAGTGGISMFLVPKMMFDDSGAITGSNGVVCTGIEHKMGIHGSPTCSLAFGSDGEDTIGYLVGHQGKGLNYMFQMMNEARLLTGLQAVAIGNASYQLALRYAKERVQSAKVTDRSPDAKPVAIIEHPDVRRNLMFCKSIAEGTRALMFEVGHYGDLAESHPDEKERVKYHDLVDLLTPIAKAYGSDQSFKVTELAVQIHGGYGYISEYGVEQHLRDVKICSIYEGTNGIQALDLLGRKMRLKNGGLFMTWLQDINAFIEKNKDHERLADLIKAVDGAKNAVAETAFFFMQSKKEDLETNLLAATPFLEMFGHAEVGKLLAQQAIIADEKLNGIYAEKGADSDDKRAALITEHPDAKFYDGKIKTAKFFAANQLPHCRALSKSIQIKDKSALEMQF